MTEHHICICTTLSLQIPYLLRHSIGEKNPKPKERGNLKKVKFIVYKSVKLQKCIISQDKVLQNDY